MGSGEWGGRRRRRAMRETLRRLYRRRATTGRAIRSISRGATETDRDRRRSHLLERPSMQPAVDEHAVVVLHDLDDPLRRLVPLVDDEHAPRVDDSVRLRRRADAAEELQSQSPRRGGVQGRERVRGGRRARRERCAARRERRGQKARRRRALGRRARATAARPRRRGATAPSRVRCHPVRVKCWFRKRARRASSETSVSSRARRTVRGAARRGAREGTIRIGGCRRRPRGWRRGARGRAPSLTRSFAVRAAAV